MPMHPATTATMLFSRQDDTFEDFEYYKYAPSMAGAIIFVIAFLASTALHSWQMSRTRTWFMIPFVTGGCFEFIGYAARAVSAQETPNWTLVPYVIQSILLLVAPSLFAASIYMELARIVLLVDGDHALFIPRKWLTRIFVGGDVVSFLMQSAGGGLMAGSDPSMGEKIVLGGLGFQIVFFGLFVLAGVSFHWKISRAPTAKCAKCPWQKHMWSLYIVSILIFIRSFIRLVEYAQGWDGHILSYEWYLFVFDGLLMWLSMIVMNIIHPSEVAALIRGSGKMVARVFQTRDVSTQYQNVQLSGPWA